jgi:fructokinase
VSVTSSVFPIFVNVDHRATACDDVAVIVVVGEALVDLVVDAHGSVTAALGGAPVNTSRACGRLGADVSFGGAISVDRFGSMLAAQLAADNVALDLVERSEQPTTLAVAELDERGAASYRFYVEGTSAPSYTTKLEDRRPDWLFTGGLGLVFEPMADTVEAMLDDRPAECAVMVDVNCRPRVVSDRERYLSRLDRVVAQADIVKVSDEDLAYMHPGVAPLDAARALLANGPRAVLLTAGAESVHVLAAAGAIDVPVPRVEVVDTIGAGDSFSGGFLAWWSGAHHTVQQLGSLDHLALAVRAAVVVAGITCTRRGADPPWLHELPGDWSTGRS